MKKRMLSIFMVIIVLVTTMNFNVFNKKTSYAENNIYTFSDGSGYAILPEGVTASTTVKGYSINEELLKEGLLVFGDYTSIPQSASKDYKNGEWRYLGYNLSGDKYTNINFPPDADSGREPWEKNIKTVQWAFDRGLCAENLLARDPLAEESVRNVLENNHFPSSWSAEKAMKYFYILSVKTPGIQPQVKFFHQTSDGRIWYQTLSGKADPIPVIKSTSVIANFELKDKAYEYQSVGYTDISTAENSEIIYRKLTITSNGYSRTIENQINPDIRLKEGTYTFELYVENDDPTGHKTDTMTKTITIIKQQEEVESNPIAVINAPDEVPINTDYEVSVEGSFASNGAKIVKIEFYRDGVLYKTLEDGSLSITEQYSSIGEYTYYAVITDSKGKSATSNQVSTKIIDNTTANAEAKLNVPRYGYEGVPFRVSTSGSKVYVNSETYSLRKAIELGYAEYRITGANKLDISPSGGEMVSEILGENEIRLYIYPKNSDTVKDIDVINILPVPHVNISLKGTKKVNRLVEFDCSNTIYHPDYNYVASKTYIEIEELSTGNKVRAYVGEAINTSFVKSRAFSDDLNLKTVFKRDGEYKVTFYTEDTRGKSDSSSVVFEIKDDIVPVGNIYIKTPIYRDSSKIATIEIDSLTKSIDGDWIDFRDYYYRYDTDNDSNFNDETWIYLGRTNGSNYNFEVTSIGNYQIKEIAREKFLNSTLEEFVSDTDKLECETISEVTVDNYAPVADFLTRPLPYADIKILASKDNISEVENTLNYLNSELIENGVNPIVDTYSFNNQDTSPYTKLNHFEFDPHKAGSEKNIAFDDERLYIVQCEGNHPMTSYSGSVCSLNHWIEAIDYRTGQVKWIYTLGNNINTYHDIQVRIDDKYLYVFYRGRWISVLDKLTGTEIKKNTYSFSNYPYYEKTSKVQLFFTDKYTFLNSAAFNKETLNFEEINLTTDYNYTSDLVLVNDTIQFIGVKHTNYYYGDYYDVEFYRCIYNKNTLNIESQQLIKKLVKFNIDYCNYNYAISKDGYITLWNTVDDKLEIYDSNNNLIKSIDVYYFADETFIDFVYDTNNKTEYIFLSETKKDDYIYYNFFDMEGNLKKRIKVDDKYYNEPIYVVRSNNKILLFRWTNNTMYVFDINTFNYNEEFASNIDTRTYDYQIYNNKYIMNFNYPFYMNNYDYEIQISKFANLLKPELSKLVNNLNWDLNSDKKYLVIIDDTNNVTDDMQEVIDKLNSESVKAIFVGNSISRSYGNDLVNGTGGSSFEYSTNYATNMSNIADYITSDIDSIIKPPQYIFKKGEKINYELFYNDYEDDPQYIESGEKWLYIHDPNYFSNNDGLASFHNVWLTEPVIQFDKVGKYTVKLKLRDNPKSDSRFDEFRKWSKESIVDIIIYDEEIPPEEVVKPKIFVNITGDLRVNHRVDFIINATKGSNNIDWNSLDISFDRADYLPNTKPNTLEFSRVFTQKGEHNITVILKDIEGNTTTMTVPFTINDDLTPVADFSLVGDGYRNELGIANFEINDSSYSNDDEIGTVEYYLEGTKYIDNGDGTYSPGGTEWYSIEPNEYGEIELDKIGLNKIKQVVTESYVNGIGLNGENLEIYRVFKSSEIIKTINVINEVPQVNYSVAPNIIKVGESISHNTTISDDTPSGDYAEYMFTHDETYFLNSQGKHNNHNVVTTEPTEILDKKGKYDFYIKIFDEDGASTDWIHGGKVIVASEPVADFELVCPGNEIGNDVFEKGSVVTIENKSYNEDYETTVANHGIKYIKIEYKNIGDDSYTTLFEEDNMINYIPTFNLPQINESGIYEVKMTVRSPEGFEATATKQFTVLDLRLNSELTPSTIYASQKYTIKATLSKDGLGAVAYIPYTDEWITLDKVNEDSNNKYYEKEITTDITLADGTYDIEIYGIYPYNNEIKEVIPLTVETPLTVNLTLTPDTEAASETISIEAFTESKVEPSSVLIDIDGEPSFYLNNVNRSGDIYSWLNTFTIPVTKPDGAYNVEVIATLPNGNIATDTKILTVNTPINLVPNELFELNIDSSADIIAYTSIYADAVQVKLFKGTIYETSFMNMSSLLIGSKKEWILNYYVPDTIPEGDYIAEFIATTPNGNIEVKNVQFFTKPKHEIIDVITDKSEYKRGEAVHIYVTTTKGSDRFELVLPNEFQKTLILSNKEVIFGNPDPYGVIYEETEDYTIWHYTFTLPWTQTNPPDGNYQLNFKVYWNGDYIEDTLNINVDGYIKYYTPSYEF